MSTLYISLQQSVCVYVSVCSCVCLCSCVAVYKHFLCWPMMLVMAQGLLIWPMKRMVPEDRDRELITVKYCSLQVKAISSKVKCQLYFNKNMNKTKKILCKLFP